MAQRATSSGSIKNPRRRSSHPPHSEPNPVTGAPITFASSLSLKSVSLYDWWLVKPEGKGIAVTGFASRERLGARFFCSAPISKRIDATTLETTDGITVTLSGFINRSRTHQNGFSFMVCNHFSLGFPHNWEECATQFFAEESVNKGFSTTKSSSAETSMYSGSNSKAFLPASLDDLPATKIRDLLMGLPQDSEHCICNLLGLFGGNTQQNISVANTTLRTPKKAKVDQKHLENDDISDTTNIMAKNFMTPSRGVVTRSRSTSKGEAFLSSNSLPDYKYDKELEKKLWSKFSVKDRGLPLTSEASKNFSGGTGTQSVLKESSATQSVLTDSSATPSVLKESSATPIALKVLSATPSVAKVSSATPSVLKASSATRSVLKGSSATPSVLKESSATQSVLKESSASTLPRQVEVKEGHNVPTVRRSGRLKERKSYVGYV